MLAAAPAECSPCSSLVATGSTPAAPGGYTVTMRFQTVGNGHSFSPSRVSRWYFSGSGKPSQITTWTQLCDAGTAGASVGLESEGPTGLRYNGSVRCVGADAIEIAELSLSGNGRTERAPAPATCAAPCAEPVATSGSSEGAGPGRYTVAMRFGVSRAGLTFAGQTAQSRWFWMGAGPPQPCVGGAPAPVAGLVGC